VVPGSRGRPFVTVSIECPGGVGSLAAAPRGGPQRRGRPEPRRNTRPFLNTDQE